MSIQNFQSLLAAGNLTMAETLTVTEKLEYIVYGFIKENIEHENDELNIPKAIKLLIASFTPNLWINSKILSSTEKDMLLAMVENHKITKKFVGCEWKLLFRASKDGYTPKDFHDKCDGKENTVCFVETEFGHVAGGYVELAWSVGGDWGDWARECDNVYMFVIRPTQQTFEFLPPEKQTTKFRVYEPKCAVAHYDREAFNFGYNDLYLREDKQGYCNKQGHYDFDSSEQVTGASRFTYIDYEVFQLIKSQ